LEHEITAVSVRKPELRRPFRPHLTWLQAWRLWGEASSKCGRERKVYLGRIKGTPIAKLLDLRMPRSWATALKILPI
jgi:hypothetical protein